MIKQLDNILKRLNYIDFIKTDNLYTVFNIQ